MKGFTNLTSQNQDENKPCPIYRGTTFEVVGVEKFFCIFVNLDLLKIVMRTSVGRLEIVISGLGFLQTGCVVLRNCEPNPEITVETKRFKIC